MKHCYHCNENVDYEKLCVIYTEPEGHVKLCPSCYKNHQAKMEYDSASHLRDISDGVQRIVNFLETYNR